MHVVRTLSLELDLYGFTHACVYVRTATASRQDAHVCIQQNCKPAVRNCYQADLAYQHQIIPNVKYLSRIRTYART